MLIVNFAHIYYFIHIISPASFDLRVTNTVHEIEFLIFSFKGSVLGNFVETNVLPIDTIARTVSVVEMIVFWLLVIIVAYHVKYDDKYKKINLNNWFGIESKIDNQNKNESPAKKTTVSHNKKGVNRQKHKGSA